MAIGIGSTSTMVDKQQRIDAAAKQLGRYLYEYRTTVLGIKRMDEMGARFAEYGIKGGLSRPTYANLETGDLPTSGRALLAALDMMGVLDAVVKAAEPESELFSAMVPEGFGGGPQL